MTANPGVDERIKSSTSGAAKTDSFIGALGVMLEPVKALFASRAKTRQDRAELCAAIIDATEMMQITPALNVHHRIHFAAQAGSGFRDPW